MKLSTTSTTTRLLLPLALAGTLSVGASQLKAQTDALEQPAVLTSISLHSLLMDIDRVGSSLVAVGERGHVLISDDNAANWRQVEVPVRVTLTSSQFVDDQHGWAVGHDGVVLASNNGGQSWNKLLDGNQANQVMLERATELLAAKEADLAAAQKDPQADMMRLEEQLENVTITFEDAEAFTDEGPSRPFLDLWFKDRNEGIIVGAFGLILRTTDGGQSWLAWFDHLDNPDGFHLNAIRQVGDTLFITAEAGALYRSTDWGHSWELLESPYEGSFFGLIGDPSGRLIAYGLRGNAFQSDDWGDSWQKIYTGIDTSLFGGTLLEDGTALLVGDAGMSLHIDTNGKLLSKQQTTNRLPLSNVIVSPDQRLLTVGLSGIRKANLSNLRSGE